jgi:hypothetical protein
VINGSDCGAGGIEEGALKRPNAGRCIATVVLAAAAQDFSVPERVDQPWRERFLKMKKPAAALMVASKRP